MGLKYGAKMPGNDDLALDIPSRYRVTESQDTHQIEAAQLSETLAQKPRFTVSWHRIQQHKAP